MLSNRGHFEDRVDKQLISKGLTFNAWLEAVSDGGKGDILTLYGLSILLDVNTVAHYRNAALQIISVRNDIMAPGPESMTHAIAVIILFRTDVTFEPVTQCLTEQFDLYIFSVRECIMSVMLMGHGVSL